LEKLHQLACSKELHASEQDAEQHALLADSYVCPADLLNGEVDQQKELQSGLQSRLRR
jgi:hypothetical protein